MKKLNRIILHIFVVLYVPALGVAQQSVVLKSTDKITHRPLTEATIHVDGVPQGVTDSPYGTIDLTLPDYSVKITVSHIGYIADTLIFTSPYPDTLDVALIPEAQTLDEVVVSTGYEQLPKERATGSFEQIDNTLFNRSVEPDILSRLENISTSTFFDKRNYNINDPRKTNDQLTIRGISSIQGDNFPLIVLDNFPFEGNIDAINPNDVESITILRDAAAASIWGTTAGNGVIVITTKKGTFNQPLNITVNSSLNFNSKPDLYAAQQANTADFIEIERILFEQGYYTNQEASSMRPALSPVVELLVRQRDGLVDAVELENKLESLRKLDVRKDYLNHFYRTGVNQQYAINVSGGSGGHNYTLAANYDNNQQPLIENQYKRTNVRAANSFRPWEGVELQANLMYAQMHRSNFFNGYGQPQLYPYAQLVDENGKPKAVNYGYRKPYIDSVAHGKLLDWQYRPLEEALLSDSRSSDQSLLASTGLKFTPLSFLSVEMRYQYHWTDQKGRNHQSVESYHTRNLINRFTQFTEDGAVYPIPLGGILELSNSTSSAHFGRVQLNANNTWENVHELTAVVGGEVRQTHTAGTNQNIYGFDDERLTYVDIDMVNRYPTFDNLGGMAVLGSSNANMRDQLQRYVSLYANTSYTYDNRYTFSGSVRRDASNLFGLTTNEKWTPLWSTGISWNLANERFYQLNSLPYLRLRASYGYSGTVDNTMSAYSIINYYSSATNTQLPYAAIANPPNPNLRWERVGILNIGLDFEFFGKRFGGQLEYYKKKTRDLFASAPLDPTTGVTRTVVNSANTSADGIDLTLNSRILTGSLQWETNFLLSYNKTIISQYLLDPNPRISSRVGINPNEGQIAYAVYSYRWAGLDPKTGDPLGYLNGDISNNWRELTRINDFDELILHGSAQPLYFGSLRNTFSWKNLSLSAVISWRFNYYFRRAALSYGNFGSWNPVHPDFNERWIKEGDENRTSVPSWIYPTPSGRDAFYSGADIHVGRADHIRLQDIRLSYQLIGRDGTWLPLKTFNLFVYANNIGILWKSNRWEIDPQTPFQGIPIPRTYAIGLSMNL